MKKFTILFCFIKIIIYLILPSLTVSLFLCLKLFFICLILWINLHIESFTEATHFSTYDVFDCAVGLVDSSYFFPINRNNWLFRLISWRFIIFILFLCEKILGCHHTVFIVLLRQSNFIKFLIDVIFVNEINWLLG